METSQLKKFAQFARCSLKEQVSAKLKLILAGESTARREHVDAVRKLEEAIKSHNEKQVIERVAYIWFNRFCALRFMDLNRYTRISVVSPAEGQFQPEVLAEAKMGHIDEEMVPEKTRQQIFALLDGKAPSQDPQGEAYRLLVVAACNFWNKAMPFLFQHIDDYTELLMPDDLLSGSSILAYTREAMTPSVCKDVEVIGWLYQFYISEKKDEVFNDLKKNKKVTPENIPAATQLFTPHWIVRYLVENSLGRLWLLNHPSSKLAEQMDYYIKPEQVETDFLRISKPEEIKICDPACGSGHMLTYAFDLLYKIYQDANYEETEIPEKILRHNLYGIEIDERSGELAAFALTMKAASKFRGLKQRRFFKNAVKPNICVLENILFKEQEMDEYMDFVGRSLFTTPLQKTLRQFEESDNFGSLIRPEAKNVSDMFNTLESKDVSGHLFLSDTHQKVLQALKQADYLSSKYTVVVANPPYMGGKGMNPRLSTWAKENYPKSKSDLFAMFIERNLDLAVKHGVMAMITMQSWMFLSSYEALREVLINQNTILSMAHLGARAFDSIGGEVVSTTAFVVENTYKLNHQGVYLRLVDGKSEAEKIELLTKAITDDIGQYLFRTQASHFKKIPGSPIAYWLSDGIYSLYDNKLIAENFAAKEGVGTRNDDVFMRMFWEVSQTNISQNKRWVLTDKAGDSRKWYMGPIYLMDWEDDGYRVKNYRNEDGSLRSRPQNTQYLFKEGVSWGKIGSSVASFRWRPEGFAFNDAAPTLFGEGVYELVGQLNSIVTRRILEIRGSTTNITTGILGEVPILELKQKDKENYIKVCDRLLTIAKRDWNSSEISCDFTTFSLLSSDSGKSTMQETYKNTRTQWHDSTLEMQRLEKENNCFFIDAYGLQNELASEVPLKEVTLTCNPYYRYGDKRTNEELEKQLLADTLQEFVSYAVGCMFGRFSLDKSGLILANQGETIEDYLKRVPEPSFPADEDNVIPILDGDWFSDDIAERFRHFLRIAFGEEHYEKNLQFIEQSLNIKGKRNYSIRDYFLKDFYNDHVRVYKKRPIYWLFSSPKGSFSALIYMHRYQPHTVGTVLQYLRDFKNEKLQARKNYLEAVSINASSSQIDKTKALKEIEKIAKIITELEEYERDVLYPLASKQVEIDLDDGVKVNYPKFGAALKKIAGLEATEE